jgi:hypothetical protein
VSSPFFQSPYQPFKAQQSFFGVLELAFPKRYDRPSPPAEEFPRLSISFRVPEQLRRPKGPIGLRKSCPYAARMLMPETSVDEHNLLKTRQSDVGIAGQFFHM